MELSWSLKPGDQILRKDLMTEFGGSRQGGISPSAVTPSIFLFSDAKVGALHGYFDGWHSDGAFHYYGEGRFGDQRMRAGNSAVRDYVSSGRALRVFNGVRGLVTYVDQFDLDATLPWYETDAPEANNGPVRKVIVFRLRPMSISPKAPKGELGYQGPTEAIPQVSAVVDLVAVEQQLTEKTIVSPSATEYEADRREQRLVLQLRDYLESAGHIVKRLRIKPPGEAKPMFADLLDETSDVLVEAKGTVAREAMRMAIGQLADYGRFRPEASRVVLVPERPRQDLMDLLLGSGVAVAWPGPSGFVVEPSAPW